MYCFERAMLMAYDNLEMMADDIERLIFSRAIRGFASVKGAEYEADKIIELIERKNLLIELKCFVDQALAMLDEESRNILCGFYFDKDNRIKQTYNERTYFRKLIKSLNRFHCILMDIGVEEEMFLEKYCKIYFIKSLYNKAKRDDEKRCRQSASLKTAANERKCRKQQSKAV